MPGTKRTLVLVLAAAVGGALCPAGGRAAAFLDEGAWLAATGGAPILPLPAHTAVAQDAFATYVPGVPQVVTYGTNAGGGGPTVTTTRTWILDTGAGQWNGSFECQSFAYPCLGAYRITYTFPFAITGLAGELTQSLGRNGRPDLTVLETPPSPCFTPGATDPHYDCRTSPFVFRGFYGAVFAPTDTITITWSPGLASSDDFEIFSLANARVAVAAPEPASLAVFAAVLLLMLGCRVAPLAGRPAHAPEVPLRDLRPGGAARTEVARAPGDGGSRAHPAAAPLYSGLRSKLNAAPL